MSTPIQYKGRTAETAVKSNASLAISRLGALEIFYKKPLPLWGADLGGIDFDNIYYYIKPEKDSASSWDDVSPEVKNTFDKLGIPEAEQKFLAGVGAQYESEMVYHSIRKDLEEKGVIFLSMDDGLRQYPELVKKYFGSLIPAADNKFAALNTAVWSGGSFVYVPPGVRVEMPLQAYFRINAKNVGQFERTLIIVDKDAFVHYVEGCTAPTYSSDSLHSAVVEIIVKEGGRCRYTTIQNWSTNVYNLVTKRAAAYKNATMEWIDANLGSKLTMKYPSVYLMEPKVPGPMSSATPYSLTTSLVVAGFIEPLVKELPMEYAIELNRLIQLQMEGSVG